MNLDKYCSLLFNSAIFILIPFFAVFSPLAKMRIVLSGSVDLRCQRSSSGSGNCCVPGWRSVPEPVKEICESREYPADNQVMQHVRCVLVYLLVLLVGVLDVRQTLSVEDRWVDLGRAGTLLDAINNSRVHATVQNDTIISRECWIIIRSWKLDTFQTSGTCLRQSHACQAARWKLCKTAPFPYTEKEDSVLLTFKDIVFRPPPISKIKIPRWVFIGTRL